MFAARNTENKPTIYEIKIQGHLDAHWSEWFYGMTITRERDGGTILCGPLPDQTVLYSVLARIRDMNLQLISVRQISTDRQENYSDVKGVSHENKNTGIPRDRTGGKGEICNEGHNESKDGFNKEKDNE